MDVIALPMKLAPRQVAKPWGKADIPAPFSSTGPDKIGEIWFEAEDAEPLALIVKYIFTSQKLSIQVHPGDAYARTIGLSGGKDECWLVLDAEPGSTLGIGLVRNLTGNELRAAALDGSIEQLLVWHPVARGDFFYIPAGTIHAIGAGLSLIEIQQNADVTFRLYDYGRPRELHLDQGIAVANAAPYRHKLARQIDLDTDQMLVDGPLFGLRLTGSAPETLEGTGPLLVIPIEGSVSVPTAAGVVTAVAGDCLAIDPGSPYHTSSGARLLLARAHENGQTA
jgi:mannose-6-phosphate isomerase